MIARTGIISNYDKDKKRVTLIWDDGGNVSLPLLMMKNKKKKQQKCKIKAKARLRKELRENTREKYEIERKLKNKVLTELTIVPFFMFIILYKF